MPVTTPKIMACQVTECSYNKNKECHAMAITVGNSHPTCDTFIKSSFQGGTDSIGGVGACRAVDCKWNESLECTAEGINVGTHENHADCVTYSKR